jgi:hypothetical protein
MDELDEGVGQRYAVVFRERSRLVVAGCLDVAKDLLLAGAANRGRT